MAESSSANNNVATFDLWAKIHLECVKAMLGFRLPNEDTVEPPEFIEEARDIIRVTSQTDWDAVMRLHGILTDGMMDTIREKDAVLQEIVAVLKSMIKRAELKKGLSNQAATEIMNILAGVVKKLDLVRAKESAISDVLQASLALVIKEKLDSRNADLHYMRVQGIIEERIQEMRRQVEMKGTKL